MANMSKRMRKMFSKKKKQSKAPLNAYKKTAYLNKQASKMSNKLTWPEKKFVSMMKELGIICESQKIVGQKIFDFYIPSKNMLIEVDGDYWHGNPEKYAEKNGMQRKNAKNDQFKDVLAKGYGYGIERVWENDLKKNYVKTKKRFKKLLK